MGEADDSVPRQRFSGPVTPFNGLPLIYGVVGYLALSVVILFGAALLASGVGLWPLLVAMLVVIVGVRWLRRL